MSIQQPTGPSGGYFAALGVTSEVLHRVLTAALHRGGDDCDLYFEHSSSTSIVLTDGTVLNMADGMGRTWYCVLE